MFVGRRAPEQRISTGQPRPRELPQPQGNPEGIPRVEAAAGRAEVSSSTCCNTQRHEALWEVFLLLLFSVRSVRYDSLRLRSANDCSDSDSAEGSRLTTAAAAAPTYEITPALSWLRQKQGGGGAVGRGRGAEGEGRAAGGLSRCVRHVVPDRSPGFPSIIHPRYVAHHASDFAVKF